MKQLSFMERPRKDGRARKRPGPKPGPRAGVPHVQRPAHSRWNPVHITLRAVRGLSSFREQVIFRAFERAFAATRRDDFRIVEFSVQTNHVHLLVEADSARALASGMKSFTVRTNRLFNIASGRGHGKVWSGRYHRVDLKTPRQVRNALVYVLNNARRHGVIRGTALVIDAGSSARWFTGWTIARVAQDPPPLTEPATTALLRWLWKKHGLIHPTETPAGLGQATRARRSRWT